jgi:hypothetical protein
MDKLVRDVLEAIERRDWESLRRDMHPYVHWTEHSVRIRGRTKVLAYLAAQPVAKAPASYEIRDRQIYRWVIDPD